ncbi:hypothetical protein [Cobetia sp. QF-1]|uniref:hypothetical protein n=1 Tax=Cobetia sp. QF-1 TaxID=1969833 RepID=UPI000B543315|nr:hypothetical protein [Cobetia sp. QF-1]
MLEWIANNAKSISAAASIGSFFIWLVYAQLLYHNFRRQRRPRVLINRGKSKGIDSLCIISNMSAESIFIEHIIARLETNCGSLLMDVTEFERNYQEGDEGGNIDGDREWRIADTTRQGPLESGKFLHIGTFSEVIERIARRSGLDLEGHWPCHEQVEFQRLTLRIIGIYGSEDHPVGVERSFLLRNEDNVCVLDPEHWDSRRLSSHWQRHKLKQLLLRISGEDISAQSTFVYPEKSDEHERA